MLTGSSLLQPVSFAKAQTQGMIAFLSLKMGLRHVMQKIVDS